MYDHCPTTDFEVTDQRLSEGLLSGARIVRLPSNAEVSKRDFEVVYETSRFPTWSLCVRHNLLYRKTENDEHACPRCQPLDNRFDAWRRSSSEAVRFVRACPSGHLDDVYWPQMISHQRTDCRPTFLRWTGGGGAMRHINIVCPDCGGSVNLGDAYGRPWPCSGRYPERRGAYSSCGEPSRIIQRGAANLRMAELLTALTIPPHSTSLHRLMEMAAIKGALVTSTPTTKEALVQTLTNLVNARLLKPTTVQEIQKYDEPDILEAVKDTVTDTGSREERHFRNQEFQALTHAALNGAPATAPQTSYGPPQFEVVRQHVRTIATRSGWLLRVTPVSRLRVVMVQKGYRRMDPTNTVVDVQFDDGSGSWYPGVELFGEGVFVDFVSDEETSVPSGGLTGHSADAWFDAWVDEVDRCQRDGIEPSTSLHPEFVWWHTLAHRLINALAIDSGYSSAAVRERVFVDIDDDSGDATGGVLLYTAQPGGDGTLGGLIALVPQFENVLDAAFRDLDSCSNDPLCGEEEYAAGKHNGAACYSCALISETSCEHRNMHLDRNLLLDNKP